MKNWNLISTSLKLSSPGDFLASLLQTGNLVRKKGIFQQPLICLLLLFVYLTPTSAQTSKPIFTTYLENDIFANTDEYYTHGCGFTYESGDISFDKIPGVTRPFFNAIGDLDDPSRLRNYSISIRQNIFTPKDIGQTELIRNDRPYGGITYLSFGFYEKRAGHLTTLALDFGMVGPSSLAADAQKKLHTWIDSRQPQGWSHQVKDEFVLNLRADRRWDFFRREQNGWGIDFIPHVEGALGNMKTSASAGIQMRFGWHIPRDFGFFVLQPGCECYVPEEGVRKNSLSFFQKIGLYGYAGLFGDLVFHNIFLDGNTFKSSHHVKKKNITSRFSAGIGLMIGQWQLKYLFVIQSKQFDAQLKAHRFGGITLSIPI